VAVEQILINTAIRPKTGFCKRLTGDIVMALMEINVSPLGTGSTSLGEFVVNMQRLLAEQGLPYELTDMGTIIEGNIDQLLAVAKALHESTFSNRAKRVYTIIKIDDRRDKEVHLGQKTGSVKKRLE